MELQDLNKLRFGDEVLYNNTICEVYGLCGPMPNEDLYYNNKATVTLWCNGLITVTLDDVEPYKEETMEEIKIDIPKGYEFAGVDDDKQQVVFTKIQPQYQKTYEECCKVINASPYVELVYNVSDGQKYSYDIDNLQIYENIRRLKICRDAYWKIAGEQIGLGKPWEPDWNDLSTNHEFIKINKGCFTYSSRVLVFPTKEMRDAFYENFKDLIEQCNELL